MKTTPAVLIGVLLVAGCAAPHQPMSPVPRPVDFAPMVPVDVLAIAPPEQYALLATLRFPAPIDAVIPSSTHDDFHPVLHVTDNRLTSAWAPDESDASPTLTFQLAESVNIDSAAIKLSLGRVSSAGNQRVRVDLFASNDGGATWSQLVNDFRPRETTLDAVTFATTLANTVRMTFETDAPDAIRDLYVCEANIIDPITVTLPPSTSPPGNGASPPPSPSPSASPVATPGSGTPPVPSPTPTPSVPLPYTPPASESDGCYVNYGMGWLPKDGSRVEFGFMVQDQADGFVAWPVKIQDHGTGVTRWGTVTRTVNVGNRIYLEGTLDDAAATRFAIEAVDIGEPSTHDTLTIWIGDGPPPYLSGTMGTGGGNIQAHPKTCDDPAVTGQPGVGRYF